jgi:DNA-binding response OmpR family regulator
MSKKYSALLIDDQEQSFHFLKEVLPEVEFTWESQPDRIFYNYDVDRFHFFVIDYHMPSLKGDEVIDFLNKVDHLKRPKFIFSCENSEKVRLQLLSLQLSDYLTKSMSKDEIRIRLLNRLESSGCFSLGNLKVNREFEVFKVGEQEVSLTENERLILKYILKNKDEQIKVKDLLEIIWNGKVSQATFNTHFSNLNKKVLSWNHTILRQKNTGVIKVVPWKN